MESQRGAPSFLGGVSCLWTPQTPLPSPCSAQPGSMGALNRKKTKLRRPAVGKSIPRAGGDLGYESPEAQNTKGPRRVAGSIGLPHKTQGFSSTRTADTEEMGFQCKHVPDTAGAILTLRQLWFTWNSFNGAPALLTYRFIFRPVFLSAPPGPGGRPQKSPPAGWRGGARPHRLSALTWCGLTSFR